MPPDPPTVPLDVRLSVTAVMVVAALVATGVLRVDSGDGVVWAVLTIFLFPVGLGYAFHEPGQGAGQSDGVFALSLIGPYFLYGAIVTAIALVKSRAGFVALCVVLAVMLSLNVKGCGAAQHIRWMSS